MLSWSFAALLLVAPVQSSVQTDPSPHSEASLVLSVREAAPGQPFLVGIRIQLDEGWHSYWKNPGDSGQATDVSWNLPDGWTASDLRWATPAEFLTDGFITYGYKGEAWKVATLTPPAAAQPGTTAEIGARLTWLVCKEACVPARQTVSARLPIATQATADEASARQVQDASDRVPMPEPTWRIGARREGAAIVLDIRPPEGQLLPDGVRFLPEQPEIINHSEPQTLTRTSVGWTLSTRLSEFASKPPTHARGILLAPPDQMLPNGRAAVAIDIPIVSPKYKLR